MLISVDSDGQKIRVPFPSGLVFNPVTAAVAASCAKGKAGEKLISEGVPGELIRLDAKAISKLFSAINECRRRFPDWYIVEVEESGGGVVRIRL